VSGYTPCFQVYYRFAFAFLFKYSLCVYVYIEDSEYFTIMTPKQTPNGKGKRVHLTLTQKLQLIRKLEAGASVSSVCEEFGVKKQTVYDIRKSEDRIRSFALKFSGGKSPQNAQVGDRKNMRVRRDINLENAVYEWYCQQRVYGESIRGVDIQNAAVKLAKDMNKEFEPSDWWLYRFRIRYGIGNKVISGEAGSGRVKEVESCMEKLNGFVKSPMADEETVEGVHAGDDGGHEGMGRRSITKPKLSLILASVDNIISYIDMSNEPGVQPYYEHFCTFREIIIEKQYGQGTQLPLNSFFRPGGGRG
jgi:transposase-like protein